MEVVSISLPSDLLQELEEVGKRRGFKGRSDLVRTALRSFVQQNQALQGHFHGSITIAYPHDKEARISEVRHAFHDIVLSLMHTHCEPETCMDVLLVGGAADRIQALHETLQRMRDVQRCSLAQVA